MGQLFQKEEALILGYMLGKYFTAPRTPGYQGSYGIKWGYLIGPQTEDGSGGYPRGRNGKPVAPLLTELCGAGGELDGGGVGAKEGLFGLGGQGVGYNSAGGGGGFYGGGSSYIQAGGGGGSSFVYQYVIEGYMELQSELGVNFNKEDYLSVENVDFKYNAQFGHGRVKINEEVFDFTGTVQVYEVPTDGLYTIECWGAQGGSLSVQQDTTLKEVGGCGGYARATFNLKAGTRLYIYVGQYGGNIKAPVRPFGGGGGGIGSGLAGGGASDVRLVEGNLFSRLIVAGGGGGCGSITGNGLNYPITRPEVEPSTGKNPAENVVPKTEKQMFIISDLSIATVDMTYTTTEDIKEDDYIRVNLYVDGLLRGTIEKSAIAGGGSDSWVFDNFDEWLEEGTEPYWATLQATVETSVTGLVIPPMGLIIRVSTKTRPNDVNPKVTKLYKEVYSIVKIGSLLTIKLEEVSEPLDLTVLKSELQIGSVLTMKLIEKVEPVELNGVLNTTLSMGSLLKIDIKTPPIQFNPEHLEIGVKLGSITIIKGV